MTDSPRVTDLGSLILFSGDVERAAAFYAALGLVLAPEQHGEGPLHFTCSIGLTHFALFAATGGVAQDAGDARGAKAAAIEGPMSHKRPGSQFFGLTVNDLAAAFVAALATGGTVVQDPRDYPWGRRALVRDPDGRVVELFERP